jgi:hypothetical protein
MEETMNLNIDGRTIESMRKLPSGELELMLTDGTIIHFLCNEPPLAINPGGGANNWVEVEFPERI